jgi:hypothetical protein
LQGTSEEGENGRYNNASEVVREALRRMEDEDARGTAGKAHGGGHPNGPDGGAARRHPARVRAGIESIVAGKYTEYDGREGLKELADGVKAGGKLLAREDSRR